MKYQASRAHPEPSENGASSAPALARSRSGVHGLSDFRAQMLRLRERHESLKTGVGSAPRPAHDGTLAALDEVWEELNVADEELRAQSEELGEAQGRLRLEQRRYRRLFDFAPEPCLVTDMLGKILHANRAAESMLATPGGSLVGRLAISLVEFSERQEVRQRVNLAATGQVQRWECELSRAPRRIVAVTIGLDTEGSLLWALRDITAQREQQRRTLALNQELEERVLARTRELELSRQTIEELLVRERQLRVQLEQQANEREEVMAVVSHDLRAPLQSVLGWAMIGREVGGSVVRRPFEVIEHNARLMTTLVNDLLDRVSVLRRDAPLVPRLVDLNALLGHVAAAFEPMWRQGGVVFSCETCPGPVAVLGDAPRLEQVLLNLLGNALKFTPAGGQIRMQLRVDEQRATILIQDSGKGMTAEQIERVFEHSYSGSSPVRAQIKSFGLGLTLVQHLIEAHEGRVRAASPGEGHGAVFEVCLPLAPPPET